MNLSESRIKQSESIPEGTFELLFNLRVYCAVFNQNSGEVDIWLKGREFDLISISQNNAHAAILQLRDFNKNLDETYFSENSFDR